MHHCSIYHSVSPWGAHRITFCATLSTCLMDKIDSIEFNSKVLVPHTPLQDRCPEVYDPENACSDGEFHITVSHCFWMYTGTSLFIGALNAIYGCTQSHDTVCLCRSLCVAHPPTIRMYTFLQVYA